MAAPSSYSSSGEEHSAITWSDTDEDIEKPPAKRVKVMSEADSPEQTRSTPTKRNDQYSLVSQRIMASMGYQMGKGLGKFGTGITQPVEESIQKGRRGLGYMLEGLEKEEVQWEQEEVHFDQHPEWLGDNNRALPTIEEFTGWISIGEKKQSIDDETQFCDINVLKRILDGKTVFDRLSEKEFLDARQRSNPFETIKGTIFQNRAAMKMANIDSVFEYMFTNPKKSNGTNLLGPFDVLYFADICAGPGGFSEYVLWRTKWHARGFGMTLKDPEDASDFKLDKFLAAPCETFDPHYGVNGYDGDGNITRPDNLIAFKEYVMSQTEGRGVHFVMGDGGISVEGLENIQEILTKQLVLCQYICALSVLRTGGHFVCKVFDMFTPFSAGLFYLLYRCFRRVCLFKPVTSRPANSERYVVCRELLPGHEAVHDYLFAVNEELITCKLNKTSQMDILEIVPAALLEEEDEFTSYLRAFNDSFGVNQALHLKKLQYFVKNTNLQDTRQAEIRKKCLDIWKVPNAPRTAPTESNPLQIFNELWVQLHTAEVHELDSSKFIPVEKNSVDFLKDVHSWKWYFACGKRMMIVGVGRNMVYAWDMKGIKPTFAPKVKELSGLELPKGTVLEVEFVQELHGEGRGQRKQDTVYVIDVIAIHGQLFANKPLKERHLYAQKLCKVVNKPCRKGVVQLRIKELYRVADLYKQFNKLSLKECKGHGVVPTAPVAHDANEFIILHGVIFIKSIKDPWQLHLSRSGKFYYFNRQNGQSLFECPSSSVASYVSVLRSRHIWIFKKSIYHELCSSDADEASKVITDDLTKHYLRDIIQQSLHSQ